MKRASLEGVSEGTAFQNKAPSGSKAAVGLWLFAYSVYGYRATSQKRSITLGYNGAFQDCFSYLYLLGNGHRGYSGELMRFYTPDRLSPFDVGGLNSYAYCKGDPVNYADPSGRMPLKKPNFLSPIERARLKGAASEYLPDFLSRPERSAIYWKLFFKAGKYRSPNTYRERNRYLHGGKLPNKNVPDDDPGYLGEWAASSEVWSLQKNVIGIGHAPVSLGRVESVPVDGLQVIIPGMKWNEYLHINSGFKGADFGRGYARVQNSQSVSPAQSLESPPSYDSLRELDPLPSYDELPDYMAALRGKT